jgi:hypothetical protein
MTDKFYTPHEYYTALSEESYEKPVVYYTPTALPVVIGERAHVVTYNHPFEMLNYAPFVMTTEVQTYDEETGSFETRNTKYVLKK